MYRCCFLAAAALGLIPTCGPLLHVTTSISLLSPFHSLAVLSKIKPELLTPNYHLLTNSGLQQYYFINVALS